MYFFIREFFGGVMKKIFLLNLFFHALFAAPILSKVVSGKIEIFEKDEALYVINKGEKGIIEWKDFSLKEGEKIIFLQKETNSSLLNRVVGKVPVLIDGQLYSNAGLFLVCERGITFEKEAVVDSHGFFASSLNLKNDLFLQGTKLTFCSNKDSNILNKGSIRSIKEMYFFAPKIENEGVIRSMEGQTCLLGATALSIVNKKDSVNIELSGHGTVLNKGYIKAVNVVLEAKVKHHTLVAITQEGVVETESIEPEKGKVFLKAKGLIEVTGEIGSIK